MRKSSTRLARPPAGRLHEALRRMLARRSPVAPSFIALVAVIALAGCGPGPLAQEPPPAHAHAPTPSPAPRRPSRSVVLADAPPETLRIESQSKGVVASCLGVLIAPRVALTAGHCLEGRSAARVRLARSEHAGFVAVERFWLDPRAPHGRTNVDRRSADVCVLLLEAPIALATYPQIARRPAPGSIRATGLRRSGDRLETVGLTLQPPLGSAYYLSQGFAKHGDSGGPIYFVGPAGDRLVIAVTAGGNENEEVLTRVDLVTEAIDHAMELASTGT
jgi:predicted small lipoprotein YifL